MTPRQWELYNLLMSEPDKWFTQEEICARIDAYVYHDRNNDNCPLIREDKIEINKSDDVDNLIVVNKYKFKIASKEDALHEMHLHVCRLKNQVEQLNAMKRKLSRDNQGKIDYELQQIDFYGTFKTE